jgi:hypothetical protein
LKGCPHGQPFFVAGQTSPIQSKYSTDHGLGTSAHIKGLGRDLTAGTDQKNGFDPRLKQLYKNTVLFQA